MENKGNHRNKKYSPKDTKTKKIGLSVFLIGLMTLLTLPSLTLSAASSAHYSSSTFKLYPQLITYAPISITVINKTGQNCNLVSVKGNYRYFAKKNQLTLAPNETAVFYAYGDKLKSSFFSTMGYSCNRTGTQGVVFKSGIKNVTSDNPAGKEAYGELLNSQTISASKTIENSAEKTTLCNIAIKVGGCVPIIIHQKKITWTIQ